MFQKRGVIKNHLNRRSFLLLKQPILKNVCYRSRFSERRFLKKANYFKSSAWDSPIRLFLIRFRLPTNLIFSPSPLGKGDRIAVEEVIAGRG